MVAAHFIKGASLTTYLRYSHTASLLLEKNNVNNFVKQ